MYYCGEGKILVNLGDRYLTYINQEGKTEVSDIPCDIEDNDIKGIYRIYPELDWRLESYIDSKGHEIFTIEDYEDYGIMEFTWNRQTSQIQFTESFNRDSLQFLDSFDDVRYMFCSLFDYREWVLWVFREQETVVYSRRRWSYGKKIATLPKAIF